MKIEYANKLERLIAPALALEAIKVHGISQSRACMSATQAADGQPQNILVIAEILGGPDGLPWDEQIRKFLTAATEIELDGIDTLVFVPASAADSNRYTSGLSAPGAMNKLKAVEFNLPHGVVRLVFMALLDVDGTLEGYAVQYSTVDGWRDLSKSEA